MIFINLHVFQPCVSQRAGDEVDVCCRDPNYKSVDFAPLLHFCILIVFFFVQACLHLLKYSNLFLADARDPWPEQEQAREESRALGEGDQWRLAKTFFLTLVVFPSLSEISNMFIFKTASTSRWSKDARNGDNTARARSKVASNLQQGRVVASNPQQPRVVENQAPVSFSPSQLPTRLEGNQPTSIFEERVKEVSSSPRSEEVKKPKRRIAYG